MIAFKGFEKGFVCRGYRFEREGWNETPEANCMKNGFHAATNPLDVLKYYPNTSNSVYCVVECGGDLNEDNYDEKVSCTRLKIIREIDLKELITYGLLYIADHPKQKLSSVVDAGYSKARNGYAVVHGTNPSAVGEKIGDILGWVKTDERGSVTDILWLIVDGTYIFPGERYTFDVAAIIAEAKSRKEERSAV